MLHGVLDLFLAVSKYNYRGKYGVNFGGMFIECKSTTGRLSEYQIQFIKDVQNDYRCIVIRTVEEFMKEIENYLES